MCLRGAKYNTTPPLPFIDWQSVSSLSKPYILPPLHVTFDPTYVMLQMDQRCTGSITRQIFQVVSTQYHLVLSLGMQLLSKANDNTGLIYQLLMSVQPIWDIDSCLGLSQFTCLRLALMSNVASLQNIHLVHFSYLSIVKHSGHHRLNSHVQSQESWTTFCLTDNTDCI